MATVSFLAVYREMFETVLFYQALWVQAGEAGRGALLGGAGAAVAALAAIGWGIFRYSLRLPLGPFFAAMSLLMCALAVVLAGKGAAALQEAGVIARRSRGHPGGALARGVPDLADARRAGGGDCHHRRRFSADPAPDRASGLRRTAK